MPQIQSTIRRLWVPAFILMLGVGSLLPVTSRAGRTYQSATAVMRNMVLRVLWPLATPMNTLTSRLSQRVERPVLGKESLLSDKIRYQDGRILALEQQVRQLQRTVAELQGLRRRLGDSYRFRLAQVIGRSSDPSSMTLHIDLGAKDGLRVGMAAVEGANLIGRVIELGQSTAVLEPITAAGNLLEVIFAPPMLDRQGLSPERYRRVQLLAAEGNLLYSDEVDRDLPVQVGDYARLRDERAPNPWPQAAQYMIVGRVTLVQPNPDDPLRQRIEVRPLLWPYHIDAVTVILPRRADEKEDGA